MKDEFTKNRPQSGEKADELSKILPERLREARGKLSGREFARRSGIISQSLSKYERVGGPLPGANLLRAFCETAHVSADWLLGLSEDRERSGQSRSQLAEVGELKIQIMQLRAQLKARDATVDNLARALAALSGPSTADARGGASSGSAAEA